MPSLQLHQICTYWGAPVADGYGGYSFDAPVELACRWEEKNEEFMNDAGETTYSRAIVYLDTDVEVGGYLFLGSSESTDPTDVDGAIPVQRYSKMPDILAVNYLRKCWL